MSTSRTISLSLVTAMMAIAPGAALAKNGADDQPNVLDDNGGLRQDSTSKDKRVTRKCTDGSTAKLKVKPDNGRLETEFEVDQNRNGVTWKVTIKRNGHVAVRRSATTKAPSGSFSVHRLLPNGAGQDKISARATSPSGAVCTASLSI